MRMRTGAKHLSVTSELAPYHLPWHRQRANTHWITEAPIQNTRLHGTNDNGPWNYHATNEAVIVLFRYDTDKY